MLKHSLFSVYCEHQRADSEGHVGQGSDVVTHVLAPAFVMGMSKQNVCS